jgi:predicted 3-demethylubiquinone-9 3-methyltransferase (glyoxalase superfamily)/uncharacterized protein YndB with AHSA1/START domain
MSKTTTPAGKKSPAASAAREFTISRTFDAPRDLVWKAWTEAERMAQWWGPKGAAIRVMKLDLRPGGIFHYAMQYQPGRDVFGRMAYREIAAPERLVFVTSFSDAQGGITRAPFPQIGETWPLEVLNTVTLTERDGKTTVSVRGEPINATGEELATFMRMFDSMRQGFGGTFDKLAAYLAQGRDAKQGMKGQAMAKNTICLWYDKDAEAAARFYAETFPDSSVGAVHRAPSDYPSGKKGDVLTVQFTVAGIPCLGLNGGPAFKHNEAFSFQVATDDQQETDRYWNAIVGNGGQESACGWCKDKWGISWQITPRVLMEALAAGGGEAKRAFDAMMGMKKIDVAAIKAARRG